MSTSHPKRIPILMNMKRNDYHDDKEDKEDDDTLDIFAELDDRCHLEFCVDHNPDTREIMHSNKTHP